MQKQERIEKLMKVCTRISYDAIRRVERSWVSVVIDHDEQAQLFCEMRYKAAMTTDRAIDVKTCRRRILMEALLTAAAHAENENDCGEYICEAEGIKELIEAAEKKASTPNKRRKESNG